MDWATHTLGAYKGTIPCPCYSIVKGCDSIEYAPYGIQA